MIADAEGLKRCPRCTLRKEPNLFYNLKQEQDGKDYYCKFCRNQISKNWQRVNPEKAAICHQNDAARKRRQYAEAKSR